MAQLVKFSPQTLQFYDLNTNISKEVFCSLPNRMSFVKTLKKFIDHLIKYDLRLCLF